MRKKNIGLDFSSLLDIIMILLFVVTSTMGINSINVKRELEAESSKKEAIQAELNLKSEKVSKLEEAVSELKSSFEEKVGELETLEAENLMLKSLTFNSKIDERALYESLMRKSKKLTLKCTTKSLTEKRAGENEAHEVEVTIYSDRASEDMEALGTVILEHNFSLTREERLRRNAEMKEFLYASLAELVKTAEAELYLISIQYDYKDVNFSQVDLEIIEEAIKDLERRLNKSCYIERLKL